MIKSIKNFMQDESGLETVEWAIVGGIIVAGSAALFVAIGADVFRGMTALDAQTSLIAVP